MGRIQPTLGSAAGFDSPPPPPPPRSLLVHVALNSPTDKYIYIKDGSPPTILQSITDIFMISNSKFDK